MKKRSLYNLELSEDKTAVIVYRTDNNLGRQGVVFKKPKSPFGYEIRKEYTPYSFPEYIIQECLQMMDIKPPKKRPIGTQFYYEGVLFLSTSFPNIYRVNGENIDVSIKTPEIVSTFVNFVTFLD